MQESTPQPKKDLSAQEKQRIDAARDKAFVLYEGKQVAHRSCGIALAETFNLATSPYQALRRGGITGAGECGAIKAGELILGELLGDPAPTGAVTPTLRAAALFYRKRWEERLDLGPGATGGCTICNNLTAPHGDFLGPDRQRFCTNLAAGVAAVVAETLARFDVDFTITPIPHLEDAEQ